MAQLKNPNSPAFGHIQGDERVLSPFASPTSKCYDLEEAFPHQQSSKKSVLTKVKERARKLRHSLSSSGRKKHDNQGHGDVSTPTWGVTLEEEDEDDEDEDPEYLGAPMYESELAPDSYKETARQHPRADPMFSEKNALPQCIKPLHEFENEDGKERSDSSSNVTATSGATQSVDSKFSGLSITNMREQKTGENCDHGLAKFGQNAEGRKDEQQQGISTPTKWDKGVSVREYFMNKLEPGEDEKALSKVISEAMSPRRAPGEMGVVEKVKEVVTSFLRPQEPSSDDSNPSSSSSSSTSTNPSLSRVTTSTGNTTSPRKSSTENSSSSPIIPVSTNADEVCDEKAHARIPQTN